LRHPAEQERKMMKILGFGIIECTYCATINILLLFFYFIRIR
jgi:hypothetical protein